MNKSNWVKSSEILVMKQIGQDGLTLIHQSSGESVPLNKEQATIWTEWPNHTLPEELDNKWQALINGKFILETIISNPFFTDHELDNLIPEVEQRYLRWYSETPDLCILFNTSNTLENNPLLVLSPYGSLIWQGVLKSHSIAEIRQETIRVFGHDRVISFLKRLMTLGFIKPDTRLINYQACDEQKLISEEFWTPQIQAQLVHAAVPWYCLWEVNTICDLRCKICYLPHYESRGPSTNQALEIARQIIDAGVLYVCLLGGEALLRRDLEEIIEYLRQAGVFVKIISNGQQLTSERIQSLVGAGLNLIEISFDGIIKETHEQSRGEGTFEKSVRAVQYSQQAGIRTAMVFTLHSDNYNDLDSLPGFMSRLKVRECYISLFKQTGLNGSSASFKPIDSSAIESVRQRLAVWKEEFNDLTIVLLPICSCGRTSTVIGYNGDVRTCSFSYGSSVGNVEQAKLVDIWRSLEPIVPLTGPIGYCSKGLAEK